MLLLGQTKYVDFRIVNAGTPVTGLTLSSLTVFFVRNTVTCTDILTLVELGSGRYTLKYVPTAEGHDYLEISYSAGGFNFDYTTSEDIISQATLFGQTNVSQITQNTPTSNALQVTSVDDPTDFTLYIYHSEDWVAGNTETYSAIGSSALDGSGNWITESFSVSPGAYHIVIRNILGAVQIIKPFLQV